MELNNHEMQASPFSARMARTIKVLNYDYDDLDEQVLAHMCQKSYIKNFNSESDQYEYLKDKYDAAKLDFDKKRK
jgi:hypothetical protein